MIDPYRLTCVAFATAALFLTFTLVILPYSIVCTFDVMMPHCCVVCTVFDYLAESYLSSGGQAGGGADSVGDISDLSSPAHQKIKTSSDISYNQDHNTQHNNATSDNSQSASNQPFQLQPLTVRTKGKKKTMCTIL